MVQRVKIMYFTLLTEDWNPDPKTYSRHLITTWDSRSKRFHTLFWPPQTPTDMWHTHMQTWCTNIHINLKNSIEKAMPLSKNTVNWVKKKKKNLFHRNWENTCKLFSDKRRSPRIHEEELELNESKSEGTAHEKWVTASDSYFFRECMQRPGEKKPVLPVSRKRQAKPTVKWYLLLLG